MNDNNKLTNLPSVDKLLGHAEIKKLIDTYNREIVLYFIRITLESFREKKQAPHITMIVKEIENSLENLFKKKLKPVINATGIIIHTNIGRSPLGEDVLKETFEVLKGYSNLEFDLERGSRGSRYYHVTELLKYLTGAGDILVVNNNAAAIMLILKAFAKDKEVIISRGELIEIGGSFRMPDIMEASGCKMIEVGTTNRTNIHDYEKQINDNTSALLKVHPSNYHIDGFTKEVELDQLVQLGKKYNLPVFYDMGSGLLKKNKLPVLKDEPCVKEALSTGVDLVSFSGDKLLGGPQSGIIAGKSHFIDILKNDPLTRALRVGKTTLALLESVCIKYLDDNAFMNELPLYKMLSQSKEELYIRAEKLQSLLKSNSMSSEIIENKATSGGGSLPGLEINSFAVVLKIKTSSNKEKAKFAENMFWGLLKQEKPLLGILRKGMILFDMMTLTDKQVEEAALMIKRQYKSYCNE